jgi:hypothetical protein
MNADMLTVMFITDIDTTMYTMPENAIVIRRNKADVQKNLANMLAHVFGKTVDPNQLVKDNYKFVDFKVTFPVVFHDLIEQYKIGPDDFVGFGDCDLIYGKLSKFLTWNKNYHILGGWFGHFVAYKNIDSIKYYFKDVPNFFELCTDASKTFGTDEIACKPTLKKCLETNQYTMFCMHKYFCDIVPPCFYHLFRKNHASVSKNFFDTTHPSKNIHHLLLDANKKTLSVVYDDGNVRDVVYAHLQKRPMIVHGPIRKDGCFIYEHELYPIDP